MCESNAYDQTGSLIMEDIMNIKVNGDIIQLVDILNQKKTLKGILKEINLDKHSIFIQVNAEL